MKKRLAAILLVLTMILSAAPAQSIFAAGISVTDASVYHTPKNDYKSGDCILTASKYMIRRGLIKRGSKAWAGVTNSTLRKSATIRGLLRNSFSFEADGLSFTIGCGQFSGKGNAARIIEIRNLLRQHPEGIVVWGRNSSTCGTHGVLVTGIKNGVVYAVDSIHNTGNSSKGVQRWQDTSMKAISNVTKYWYVKQVGPAKNAPKPKPGQPMKPISASNVNYASALSISDQSIPVKLDQGMGFGVRGVISSNYRIKSVVAGVYDSTGKAIISKTVQPNTWSYDLQNIDYDIKFGTVPAGTFTYKISATDEKKSAVLVRSSFKVVATSTLNIKSCKAPTKIKKGKAFTIKGKISSNNILKNVTITVTDSKGKVKYRAIAAPGSKSFDVKKLDKKIKFKKLAKGTYYYKIVASDTVKTKTLVNRKFTVY